MAEGKGATAQAPPHKAVSTTSTHRPVQALASSVGAATLTPADTGVEQRVYLGYVRRELDDESACMELPFTMILLLSFSCLAILHLNQQAVFAVEQAIELDIRENANFAWSHAFGHKSLADVHSIADLWSWVRLGFIPLVVQPIWYTSEGYDDAVTSAFASSGLWTTPTPDLETVGSNETRQRWALPEMLPGELLHFNHIVGGIRYRQQVSDAGYDLCRFPGSAPDEIWFEWFGKPCYPAWEELAFVPDSYSTEEFTNPAPVTEWMLTDHDSLDRMLQMLVDMEDGCEQLEAKGRECYCESCVGQEMLTPWITERTQRVEITLATINPEYGLITLTAVNFFFNRGSQIQKRVEVMSTWMDHFSKPGMDIIPVAVCDTVWVVLMLSIFVAESKDVVFIMWKGGWKWYKTIWEEYLTIWNIIDWVSISMAFLAISAFAQLWFLTFELNEDFVLLSEASAETAGRDVYTQLVSDFYDKVEIVCSNERSFRSLLCVYPLIIMLRLFKSFAAQPRLAVVTATMVEASQDLFHFMIVWGAVFFCLCLDAIIIFGQDVHAFTTFPRSLHSCFRMMFGDWDWEPMQHVRRHYAMIWFWLFVVVVILILLNMLLAIIMEAYMEVKKNTHDASTLQFQVREMMRRRQQFKRKQRVRLNDIWNAFTAEEPDEKAMLGSEKLITHEMVTDTVPGIQEKQSRRTLENAYKAAHKNDSPFSIESAEQRIKVLNAETSLLKDELFFTFDRVQHYDTTPGDQAEDPSAEAPSSIDAAADAAAVAAEAAAAPAITEELLRVVGVEVGRLSAETASVLAQTMKRVDRRQGRCEQRQSEMLGAIREMSQNIQHLQSEATSLTNKLHAYAHQQARCNPKRSNGRGGGTVMLGCMSLSDSGQQPPGRPTDSGHATPSLG